MNLLLQKFDLKEKIKLVMYKIGTICNICE